mgnify:FL=1
MGYLRQERTHAAKASQMQEFTTYELMFELIARIKEAGLTTASSRQLLMLGRACIEELATRTMRKEG